MRLMSVKNPPAFFRFSNDSLLCPSDAQTYRKVYRRYSTATNNNSAHSLISHYFSNSNFVLPFSFFLLDLFFLILFLFQCIKKFFLFSITVLFFETKKKKNAEQLEDMQEKRCLGNGR